MAEQFPEMFPGMFIADIETADDFDQLVRAFYRLAAVDDLLGPIFDAADIEWEHHYDTLTRFWAWQILGERNYSANPLRAHEPVHARTPFRPEHFARWLELFHATVDAGFSGPRAEATKQRATKMAGAMERLLDGVHGPADAPIEPLQRLSERSNRRSL